MLLLIYLMVLRDNTTPNSKEHDLAAGLSFLSSRSSSALAPQSYTAKAIHLPNSNTQQISTKVNSAK
jgi:hypothetical protein